MDFSPIKRAYHRLFNSGHGRSNLAKKNAAASLIAKGYGMCVSVLMVPMTLSYLTKVEYGLWLAMTTVITWFAFLDVGIGNGLKNKLAEALAKEDRELARTYVSTAFGLFFIIALAMGCVMLAANCLLDWAKVFNAPDGLRGEIHFVMVVLEVSFCVTFAIGAWGVTLTALQQTWRGLWVSLAGSTLSLAGMWLLIHTTQGSLRTAVFVFSGVPLLVTATMFLLVFWKWFGFLRPSLRYFDRRRIRDMLGLGVQFFIMQLAVLVVFTSANMILTRLFGPEEVVPYNIAFKYFSIVTMLFFLVAGPLWPAYTDAWHRGDFAWIKHAIKRQRQLWGLMFLATLAMAAAAPFVYKIWLGGKVDVPWSLTLVMVAYVSVSNLSNVYSMPINGIGKLRLSLCFCAVMTLIYIPLAVGLGRLLGPAGVALATCLILLPGVFTGPMQLHRLLSGTARGIWNK
jgi:O-antigen/teichoic acid export membrane protein